jgi:FtsZ-binding cell division protein ZapB
MPIGKFREVLVDTAKIFDTLDRKIEKLVARLQVLTGENDRLKTDLAAARKAEKDAAEARGSVERLEKDQQTVRERLEKLIASLEAAEEKG